MCTVLQLQLFGDFVCATTITMKKRALVRRKVLMITKPEQDGLFHKMRVQLNAQIVCSIHSKTKRGSVVVFLVSSHFEATQLINN